MEQWAGKVAVVTGASVGIGAAIAKQLVQNGMVVAGLARRVDKIKELAQTLEECPGKLYAVECDVSKEESVVSAFAWVQENLGSVNVLVNNAGITKESSLIDGSLEDWRAVFDVNVFGLCLCTREAVRMMRDAGGDGVVINVNSLAGERVPFIPGFSVYPASKRALIALAQTLRHELTGTRIRVTGISPGLVATELMVSYSTYSEEALASLPTLDPEDVAAAAVYILSNAPNVVVQDIILRPLGESCVPRHAMEIIQLAETKKAFARPEERYTNPYKEALRLRQLWSYHKPLSKAREAQEARSLYKQASKHAEREEFENVFGLIAKGLLLNPRSHAFYALRGDMYMRQGRWTEAIRNYENGRSMTKFDGRLSKIEARILYNKQLIESYTKRGNWYCENNMLMEAVGDYEQVFVLKLRSVSVTLVEILRKLNKYEVFQRYWEQFLTEATDARMSALLTIHAEYKIHLKEMAVARQMLLKAVNLSKENVQAQELLQVVYSTGHSLAAYTVIWCMHGCYDKALVTVEKGLDCIPYNPGFTLLKTIILRLSGRLEEATRWLKYVDKNVRKLHEPLKDKQQSIMAKLSIGETRNELIKQWYFIRYDMALRCIQNDRLEEAARIIYASNLTKYFMEPYVLLGDIFYKRGNVDSALDAYVKCREKIRELRLSRSGKTVDATERIIDILNDRARSAAHARNSKDAVRAADSVLRILDEDKVGLQELGAQRGRALLQKARGLLQISKKGRNEGRECCEAAADSLRFVREIDESGLYRSLYGDRSTESVIDRFAPKRKLPRSLKILTQFS